MSNRVKREGKEEKRRAKLVNRSFKAIDGVCSAPRWFYREHGIKGPNNPVSRFDV